MGRHQCLPLTSVQLKGKHCQKLHCCNGVVDTFGPWDIQLNNLLLGCTFLFRILNRSSGKTDKDQNTYWPYHHHLIECEVKKNQLSTPRRVVDNVSIASLEHEILIDLKNSHTSLEIEKNLSSRCTGLQLHFSRDNFDGIKL